MGLYKILWKRSAEKDLRKIETRSIRRIINKIEILSETPHPPQSIKIKNSEDSYRLRIGNYRVIYQVDTKQKAVIIYYVRLRGEAYER